MFVVLSGGVWLFGMVVYYIKCKGIGVEVILVVVVVLFIVVDLVLIL